MTPTTPPQSLTRPSAENPSNSNPVQPAPRLYNIFSRPNSASVRPLRPTPLPAFTRASGGGGCLRGYYTKSRVRKVLLVGGVSGFAVIIGDYLDFGRFIRESLGQVVGALYTVFCSWVISWGTIPAVRADS
ncbi:hypothetical protein HOY82DRAFT_293069 [Tuber indicum]|nr:hypothetical protein HOY82DRAFT_293069 [Tuber indicum]